MKKLGYSDTPPDSYYEAIRDTLDTNFDLDTPYNQAAAKHDAIHELAIDLHNKNPELQSKIDKYKQRYFK